MKIAESAAHTVSDTFVKGLLTVADSMVPVVLAGLNDEAALEAWADAETREGVRAAILRKLKAGSMSVEKIPTLVAFARVAEEVREKGVVSTMHELSRVVDETQRPRSGDKFTDAEIAIARFQFGDTRVCSNPECGEEGDLIEDFGLRRMKGPGSMVRPQAHCLKCRNKARPREDRASGRKVKTSRQLSIAAKPAAPPAAPRPGVIRRKSGQAGKSHKAAKAG